MTATSADLAAWLDKRQAHIDVLADTVYFGIKATGPEFDALMDARRSLPLAVKAIRDVLEWHTPTEWTFTVHINDLCTYTGPGECGDDCPARDTYHVCEGCLPCDWKLLYDLANDHNVWLVEWPCPTLDAIAAALYPEES